MNWCEVEFQQLYAEPSRNGVYKKKEHHGSGVKIVNMGELFAFDFINGQPMKRLQLTGPEIARSSLREGDLLFGRRSLVESGAGKCSVVEELNEPTTFESSIIRVRVDQSKARPKFLYYWFKSPIGRGRVRAIVTGVNVKGIRGTVLQKIDVTLPPIATQDRIVEILSSYDDLIENNRRRIELLEQSARLLYKEWFVHLRFPGHEHVTITNGIPDGWERCTLGDVLTLQRGFDLPKRHRKKGNVPIYASSGINGYHSEAKVKAPGIVTGRSGSLGKVLFVPHDFWPLNTTLWVKEFKQVSALFAQHLLTSLKLEQYNGGAAVPTLNRNDAHRIEVRRPSGTIGQLFDEFAKKQKSQIEVLTQQNAKLTEARELLLPRLMSGEITV